VDINVGNTIVNGDLTLSGDIKSNSNINIDINLADSTLRRWQFGEDGALTLPSVGKINNGAYDWTFGSTGNTTFPTGLTLGAPRGVGTVNFTAAVDKEFQIETGTATSGKLWQFGTDGDLKIPGNIKSDGNINIDINLSDSTLRRWQFGEDGDLETPGGIQVAGILKIDDGVHEKLQTKADATGTVTHDCASGHIFYHTSPDANWTANFTNLNLSTGYVTAVSLIIVQGATGYYPTVVQIGGVSQTINWQGNTNPTPSTNRTDVVTFSIICTATDTYTVLGQLTGF
jgi:hypothetical protein